VAISQLEMTANSTYWFEDNPKNGLPVLQGFPKKFTRQKSAHIRVLLAEKGCQTNGSM